MHNGMEDLTEKMSAQWTGSCDTWGLTGYWFWWAGDNHKPPIFPRGSRNKEKLNLVDQGKRKNING